MSGGYLIKVKFAAGTYTASTNWGVSASCPSGPRQAVERLGQMLYGAEVSLRIEESDMNTPIGESLFRLYCPEFH